jgi:Ca2+-binding EF-hand superfamily protein
MMKMVLLSAAAAALLASPSLAQVIGAAAGPRPEMTRASVEADVRNAFARVDANRDGFVTEAEAKTLREAARTERQGKRSERRAGLFDRLDADKDGAISRAEFDAPRGDRAEKRAGRREARGERGARRDGHGFVRFGGKAFERFDGNKDGRVSLQEATEQALTRFDRIDANRDGTISVDERRAAFQARRRG